MSTILRTIKGFPKGKLAEELIFLINRDCDKQKRVSFYSELRELEQQSLIFRDPNGRWRARYFVEQSSSENVEKKEGEQDLLNAVPGHFEEVTHKTSETKVENQRSQAKFTDIIKYFKSSVRADPRGSLGTIPETHNTKWQLIYGSLPVLTEDEDTHIIRLSLELANLPDTFRQALIRREENDKSISLGWPIQSGLDRSAPKLWPVGLLSGQYQRTEKELIIEFDLQNIFVNPLWAKENYRAIGWSRNKLNLIFNIGSAAPLKSRDFILKLREVAAGFYNGNLNGRQLSKELSFSKTMIWDCFGVFLSDDNTFNQGIIEDFNSFEKFSEEQFKDTAAYDFINGSNLIEPFNPAINVGSTNEAQIKAVQNGLSTSISTITGPPGTGKSQTIVSLVASTLINEGSVLFASKNHQALDAVIDRLSALCSDVNFIVRTYDKGGDIDVSFDDVLKRILLEPTDPLDDYDPQLRSKLKSLASARNNALIKKDLLEKVECDIADLLYRLRYREKAQHKFIKGELNREFKRSFFQKIFSSVINLFKQKPEPISLEEKAAKNDAPIETLQARLKELRQKKKGLADYSNILELTDEISDLSKHVLQLVLKAQGILSDNALKKLTEEVDVQNLTGKSTKISKSTAEKIIKSKPVWVSSVQAAPKRIPLIAGLFDLLILDEATQCDIASAIPLLYRAKRAVILGDDKQLKFIPNIGKAQDLNFMKLHGLDPTNYSRFSHSSLSLFDAGIRVPNCQKSLLRSQYRSAPEIVEYISSEFYNGALNVAVDVEKLKCPKNQKPGITWTNVKPKLEIRNDHVNCAELEAIIHHLKVLLVEQKYKGSVGFVTPFRAQVLEFENLINQKISGEVLAKAKLKAGTVDSFQGDERDLVIFSPTLSNNSTQAAVSFVQKDFRRINVAISRAKAVAHIFGDLDYARSNAVRSLGKLAEFATRKRIQNIGENTFDSEWERQVYYALKNKGLDPIPQYEIAGRRLDFALFGQNNIKLDLEVDGRRWHTDIDGNRKVSDIWRDHQLTSMGWKVIRFWVDELDKDMEKCIGLVEQELT